MRDMISIYLICTFILLKQSKILRPVLINCNVCDAKEKEKKKKKKGEWVCVYSDSSKTISISIPFSCQINWGNSLVFATQGGRQTPWHRQRGSQEQLECHIAVAVTRQRGEHSG